MNSATKFFLILLRLAIGWHLLFAGGIPKFQSDYKGSEAYLQNSGGPLAPMFHELAGDRLADKLAVPKESTQLPAALDQEWSDYFDAFADHYKLSADQRDAATRKMNAVKDKAVKWMTGEEVTIKQPSLYGPPAEVTKTVPEWVKEYQSKRKKLREEAQAAYHFIPTNQTLADNTRDQSADKAEVARIRGELTQGLDKFKKELKDDLRSVLTDDQLKQQGPLPEPVKPSWSHMTRLDWIDFQVRWGLTIAGACLILGFLTRLNCVIGAALLLMFYLAVPPLPGLPESFRAEGYPYVNKNIVELLALLTLAMTRSGRWAGIDGILYYLNPFRKKTPEPHPVAPSRRDGFAPYQATATESSRQPVESHPK